MGANLKAEVDYRFPFPSFSQLRGWFFTTPEKVEPCLSSGAQLGISPGTSFHPSLALQNKVPKHLLVF